MKIHFFMTGMRSSKLDIDKKLPDVMKIYPDAEIKKINFDDVECIHAIGIIKELKLIKMLDVNINSEINIDMYAFSDFNYTFFDISFDIEIDHIRLLMEKPSFHESLVLDSNVIINDESRNFAVIITEYLISFFGNRSFSDLENFKSNDLSALKDNLDLIYEKTALRPYCTNGINDMMSLGPMNHLFIIEDYENEIKTNESIWECITIDNDIVYVNEPKYLYVCKNEDYYKRLFQHHFLYSSATNKLEFIRRNCILYLSNIRTCGLSIRENIISNNQNPYFWKELKKTIEIMDLNFLEFHADSIRITFGVLYSPFQQLITTKYLEKIKVDLSRNIKKTEKFLDQVRYASDNLSTPSHTHDENILQQETEKVNDRILMLSFIAMAVSAIGMMRSDEIELGFKIMSGAGIFSLPIIYYLVRSFQGKISSHRNKKSEKARKIKDRTQSLDQMKKEIEMIDLSDELPKDLKKEFKELKNNWIINAEKELKKLKGIN